MIGQFFEAPADDAKYLVEALRKAKVNQRISMHMSAPHPAPTPRCASG